jgi:hypothetical protein
MQETYKEFGMAGKDILDDEDDFEKLLNNFINSNGDKNGTDEEADDSAFIQLSDEDEKADEQITNEIDQDLVASIAAGKEAAVEQANQPNLGCDESELAQAFINFQTSVNKLATEKLKQKFECDFTIDDLYPNYKPSVGRVLSNDMVNGWLLLAKMYPNDVGNFSPASSDEEFLNFAEKLNNQDLQLAIISYVEVLIDIESCELSYQAKLVKYRETHIKRIMYEEYLARKERQRRFVEAIQKRNFPIDAERLVSNYFRVAQKDFDGAYKALTTNPAIFAPIDFSKIKPKLFGLIKVTPKDGIRLNIEIGKFLKKLKA